MICSQIWLIPLVDDCQCRPITQFETKTLVRKWFQIQRKKSCSTLGGFVKNWRNTYSSKSFNGMGWFWTMSHFGGSWVGTWRRHAKSIRRSFNMMLLMSLWTIVSLHVCELWEHGSLLWDSLMTSSSMMYSLQMSCIIMQKEVVGC